MQKHPQALIYQALRDFLKKSVRHRAGTRWEQKEAKRKTPKAFIFRGFLL